VQFQQVLIEPGQDVETVRSTPAGELVMSREGGQLLSWALPEAYR